MVVGWGMPTMDIETQLKIQKEVCDLLKFMAAPLPTVGTSGTHMYTNRKHVLQIVSIVQHVCETIPNTRFLA